MKQLKVELVGSLIVDDVKRIGQDEDSMKVLDNLMAVLVKSGTTDPYIEIDNDIVTIGWVAWLPS